MNAVSRVFRRLHAAHSNDDRATSSPWRELLAVCSLPGVFAAPLAVLHNQPWVPFVGYCANYSFEDGSLALQLALPFEIVLGAALATLAVVIVGAAPRQPEPTFATRGRPFWDTLFVELPTLMPMLVRTARRCAVLVPIWLAALVGGVVAARYLPFMPIDASLMHIRKWYLAYHLPLWIGDASLGVFYLVGIPCLAIAGLRSREGAPIWGFAIWLLAAGAIGYRVSLYVSLRATDTGLGSFGPFLHVFYWGTYFAWGAGAVAYLTSRVLAMVMGGARWRRSEQWPESAGPRAGADEVERTLTTPAVKPKRRIRRREAVWLVIAAFLMVYPVLGYVTIDLYQRGALNSRLERPLVLGVFLPVWLLSFGPLKSEFDGFEYRLETKSGGAIIRHDVMFSTNVADDRTGVLDADTNAALHAPLLLSCVTHWTRARPKGAELSRSTEVAVRLTRQQAKAVEHAIRSWRGRRRDFHHFEYWYEFPSFEGKHPVVLFWADINAELSVTGHEESLGYQIEAFGPKECSAARGLIQSINQALPQSIRKDHALPLPPERK